MAKTMDAENLWDLWLRKNPVAIKTMQDAIDQNIDTIESMLTDLMALNEITEDQQSIERSNSFTGKWKTLVEEYMPLAHLDEKERHSIESNAMIQSTLQLLALDNWCPSIPYQEYIDYLAGELGMPKLEKKSVSRLAGQLIHRKLWISNRDTQRRIRASQKSGWHVMIESRTNKDESQTVKDKQKIFKDEPSHLPVYETAYFEIINILNRLDHTKQKDEECLAFRLKLKEWGKERIIDAIEKEMPSILDLYRKLQQGKGLDGGKDTFFDDMEKVHQRYHSFIALGKISSNVWNRNDGLNEKFYLYLCVIYVYVRHYTKPQYRKIALYCLEEIYGANTIDCIIKHWTGDAIFREYVLDADIDNPYKNKNRFYTHKLCIVFSTLVFQSMAVCLKKKDGKMSSQNQLREGLLKNLNLRLSNKYKLWGMILCDRNWIDFDLWFMYRPFILPAWKWANAENMFINFKTAQEWLNFFYDWRNGSKGKESLSHIISLLDKMGIGASESLIDGILHQMYHAENIDKALKRIEEYYIWSLYDDLGPNVELDPKQAIHNLNEKKGLKVPDHAKLIQNIYYEVYDNAYLFEKQEILKKHQISLQGKSMMENNEIQSRIKYILENYRGDREQIKNFKCYIKRASWLSEIRSVGLKILCNDYNVKCSDVPDSKKYFY